MSCVLVHHISSSFRHRFVCVRLWNQTFSRMFCKMGLFNSVGFILLKIARATNESEVFVDRSHYKWFVLLFAWHMIVPLPQLILCVGATKLFLGTLGWCPGTSLTSTLVRFKYHWICIRYVATFTNFPAATPNKYSTIMDNHNPEICLDGYIYTTSPVPCTLHTLLCSCFYSGKEKSYTFWSNCLIKVNVTKLLMVILKEDFAECFEKWKGCCDKWGPKGSTCPR